MLKNSIRLLIWIALVFCVGCASQKNIWKYNNELMKKEIYKVSFINYLNKENDVHVKDEPDLNYKKSGLYEVRNFLIGGIIKDNDILSVQFFDNRIDVYSEILLDEWVYVFTR